MSCEEIRARYFAGPLPKGDADLQAHLAACAGCRDAARGLAAVDAGLAELASEPVAAPPFDALRSAAQSAGRAQKRRAKVRRALPFALAGAAAAAAAGLLVFVSARPAVAPSAAAGQVLEAAAGPAPAVLPSGAHLQVESGRAVVASTGPHERVRLESGAVSLEVPKLEAGHGLSVVTPEAEVSVHGTRFRVSRDRDGTRVVVSEGKVQVQPEGEGRPSLLLGPGESALVEPLPVYRGRARAAAVTALDRGELGAAEARLEELLATRPVGADAGEAHALSAVARAAAGDRPGAIERYRRALAALPADARPLWADNAAAELAMLVERDDPRAAAAAWQTYLQRFPEGVHAPLARTRLGRRR